MLEFQRVREVLAFLFKDCSRSLFEHQGLYYILWFDHNYKHASVFLWFQAAYLRLQLLDQAFLANTPTYHLSKPPGIPFIAYKHLAKTTGSTKETHLAEILHLLPEGCLRQALNLETSQIRPYFEDWVGVSKSALFMSSN